MKEKILNIKDMISNYKKAAIAFSGGVDSTLLAKLAYDILGDNALAITIVGDMHSKTEIQEGRELAKKIGIPHVEIDITGLSIEGFNDNTKERCYHCKKYLFDLITKKANEYGITNIFDGSNVDDLSDYRPGMKALKELNIISPLKEAGFSKAEIREFSKEVSLPTWNKPAFACLASRIPYGTKIGKDNLSMVEKGEDYLNQIGFRQYRVRHHGEIARIEIEVSELHKALDSKIIKLIDDKFKEIGFKYVALDLSGYKQGSMN